VHQFLGTKRYQRQATPAINNCTRIETVMNNIFPFLNRIMNLKPKVLKLSVILHLYPFSLKISICLIINHYYQSISKYAFFTGTFLEVKTKRYL